MYKEIVICTIIIISIVTLDIFLQDYTKDATVEIDGILSEIKLDIENLDNEKAKEQLKELEEKEDSSVDIDKLVKDFVNMKEITRTMLVSLVDKIEISENKEITIYYKFNILNMGKEDNKLQNVG